MKKFLLGALTAIMLISSGAFAEAQADVQEQCCRNYCAQDCDDASGDYCGRYGCGQGSRR